MHRRTPTLPSEGHRGPRGRGATVPRDGGAPGTGWFPTILTTQTVALQSVFRRTGRTRLRSLNLPPSPRGPLTWVPSFTSRHNSCIRGW